MVEAARSVSFDDEAQVLRGRVTDVSGTPLSGGRVVLVHGVWGPPEELVPPFSHSHPHHQPRPATPSPRLITRPISLSGTDGDGQFFLYEESSSAPDKRFLIVEHPRGQRTLELEAVSEVRVMLPPTLQATIRAHTRSTGPLALSSVRVFWSGPDGEEAWTTSPLYPATASPVLESTRLPYWVGAGWFANVPAVALEARVALPVGAVRITASANSVTNHLHVTVPNTGPPELLIEVRIPHPEAAQIRLELDPPMNGHVSHSVWVWQHPDTPYFASLSARNTRPPTLRNLPPGRYFVGPGTRAPPRCRRSFLLSEGENRTVRIDGRSCMANIRMPYD